MRISATAVLCLAAMWLLGACATTGETTEKDAKAAPRAEAEVQFGDRPNERVMGCTNSCTYGRGECYRYCRCIYSHAGVAITARDYKTLGASYGRRGHLPVTQPTAVAAQRACDNT